MMQMIIMAIYSVMMTAIGSFFSILILPIIGATFMVILQNGFPTLLAFLHFGWGAWFCIFAAIRTVMMMLVPGKFKIERKQNVANRGETRKGIEGMASCEMAGIGWDALPVHAKDVAIRHDRANPQNAWFPSHTLKGIEVNREE
jgi:hypothetical protein